MSAAENNAADRGQPIGGQDEHKITYSIPFANQPVNPAATAFTEGEPEEEANTTASATAGGRIHPVTEITASCDEDPLDPFSPERLRVEEDFLAEAEAVVTALPVQKPSNQVFVRVRPGDDYRIVCAIIESVGDRACYLVTPGVLSGLRNEPAVSRRQLVLATTMDGGLFLWPLKLQHSGGTPNPWTASALAAAREAERNWVRVSSNQASKRYDCLRAKVDFGAPVWPDQPFKELLALAFEGRLIDSLGHPVLRRLRGEE